MASSINASTTAGLVNTADTSGVLNIQTAGTTAISIDASQAVSFTNSANLPNTFGFKNRIINGAMVIDQRNAGASVTNVATATTYTLDRWAYYAAQASKFTLQQNAGSVTPPVGFSNYLGITSLSAYSVGASDTFLLIHKIEGYNIADLAWGTANATAVTLSFRVRSSLTGTFGGSITNGAENRSYPFSYSVSSANTWTTVSITIPGDTSGTWTTTNGSGLQVFFGLGAGSTYSGTAGAWAGTAYYSATGATSVVGTNGATFYITGVQLEKGATATSFDYRPYGTELALCYRYYYKIKSGGTSYSGLGVGYNGDTTTAYNITSFPVTMRTRPTALETTGTATDYAVAYGITATACNSVPTYSSPSNEFQGISNFFLASGLTAGQGSRGCSNLNNASAFLAWSAEL